MIRKVPVDDLIKPKDQMTCLSCETVVDKNWMNPDIKKDVGELCAPCYSKEKRYEDI